MNRARTAAAILVLAAAATPAFAQDRNATNSIFLEGGGPGLAYSLNYERIFENDFGLRVGFSYLSVSGTASSGTSTANGTISMWTVPVLANYLGINWGNHSLELGGGATVVGLSGAGSIGAFAGSGSGTLVLGAADLGRLVRDQAEVLGGRREARPAEADVAGPAGGRRRRGAGGEIAAVGSRAPGEQRVIGVRTVGVEPVHEDRVRARGRVVQAH